MLNSKSLFDILGELKILLFFQVQDRSKLFYEYISICPWLDLQIKTCFDLPGKVNMKLNQIRSIH